MSSVKPSENNRGRERAILDFMTELLALDRLDDILQAIVQETPKLINSQGCSIYLAPHLVKQYKGKLIDGDGEEINADQIQQDFIILAAASVFRDLSAKVGRYFYRAGEGLTGWVFKTKQPLLLSDMDDEEELRQYDGLHWKNKYKGARHYYNMRDRSPKPFLAIPLVLGNRCYGAIRVGTSQDRRPFPNWAKGVFLSFGRVTSRRIEIDTTIQEQKTSIRKQKRSIENLIKIGSISISNKRESFNAILEETQKVVGASACCLYLPDRYGETVKLEATIKSDSKTEPNQSPPDSYKRHEGLTGWIFNTSKPLLINDTASFSKKKRLNNRDLEQYSDSCWINSDSRLIQAAENEVLCEGNEFPHFMGVPVLTGGRWSQGVLTVRSKVSERPFTRYGLSLLKEIAANISMLLANLERQKLNEMLVRIGQEHGDRLFQYVVEQLPELVLARGCSIFLKSGEASSFKLSYTNSANSIKDPRTRKTSSADYQPGIGKTGIVAKLGRSLVINHYGRGNLDRRKLREDYEKYINDERYQDINLVGILKDENSRDVGLARLVRTSTDEPKFSRPEREIFKRFVHSAVYTEDGLPPNVGTKRCEEGGGGFTKSFLACPLRDRQGTVFGVLGIPRTFPGGIFTDEALALTASVCNRLSAVIEKERVLEQNVRILSEINTQINSSFGSKDLNRILRSILKAVTRTFGFEFASIQLVDLIENTVYTEMAMKNRDIPKALDPNKWIRKASHSLDPPASEMRDIHAWLLREHRKEAIIRGWDPHFDKGIYEKHGHKDLIRVFIPIVAKNPHRIIGTLEAGHNIDRKSDIDGEDVTMLKALADQAAIAIRNHTVQDELIKAELLQLVPALSHILKTPAGMLLMQFKEITKQLARKRPDLASLRELIEWANRSTLTIYSMSSTLAMEVESREDLRGIQEADQVDLIAFIKEVLHVFVLPTYPGDTADVRIKVSDALTQSYVPLSKLETTWLKVILLNLFHNARKYSPEGGIIHLVCHQDPSQGIVMSVVDQGPGFEPRILRHLFEQGVCTKAEGWPEGSGLGLYTVKSLADKLGWTCQAGNISPRGAKFDVCIPKGWRGQI